MGKPRKKWEPEYRYGGPPADYMMPNPLGENQAVWRTPKPKKRRRK